MRMRLAPGAPPISIGGVEPITIERTKGGVAKFVNVSKDLLFVDFCVTWDAGLDGLLGTTDDVCTNVDQVSLFSIGGHVVLLVL